MSGRMTWASAVSELRDTRHAAQEAATTVAARLDGAVPDVAFVFFSAEHRSDVTALVEAVSEDLLPRHWIACSAGGVIGDGREVEERPGLSITAGRLPGVSVKTFRLDESDLPDADAAPRAWETALGSTAGERPHFLLLADPFTFPTDDFVRGLDYAFPKSVKAGGLASAAEEPGGNVLVCDGDVLRDGAVGVSLTGPLLVDTIVAQGCRAIGETMRVTRARDNFILELDGRPPIEVLRELLPRLSERDQRLARSAMFLGVSVDALADEPGPDDYLVRNILGVSPDNGALAVGDEPRIGQSVRFHLRDALASAEDLDIHLARYVADGLARPHGALLFSCLGRGKNLYGRPDHDTDAFKEKVGEVPLGGFFANGEIGMVRGTTQLHGFTSSFVLFREASG